MFIGTRKGWLTSFATTSMFHKILHALQVNPSPKPVKNVEQRCRNPSLGLTTKAKGLQGCGPKGSLGVTSYTPESVRKCEGVNPHTPKATPTLGDGVPMESPNFRVQFQWSKLNGL
jgi:hypothetical protein